MQTIHEIVRRAEDNYINGTTKRGKYVNWSMHDTIETIDAYLASKHISGPKDSLGRDKPFFNIVTAVANIWWRATDLDRKDIRIIPDSSSDVAVAFIATCLLQNWMKSARFGVFLNEWGRALARYGSAVVKFVEKNGELCASVVPWNRFIADPVDFDAIPRIEKFYKTAEQLKTMATPGHPDYAGYNLTQVDALVTAVAARKTLDGQQQDNQGDFIELYEVHGNLPSYMLLDDPKPVDDMDTTYRQQMHVLSFVEGKNDKWKDFTLYKGKEAKDPYMKTDLIKEDGRTLATGGVEYCFDAQWMQNHTMKSVKDYLDLVSKVIVTTTDQNLVGRNVLSNLETGDILVTAVNSETGVLQMSKPEINQFLDYGAQWRQMAQEITSTPDAMRGITLPSATAYRQAALLTQASNSFFEMMTENKGLALEDMLREFILPYLEKQLDNTDEIMAVLDDAGVAEIDALYVPKEAIRQYNTGVKKAVLSGNVPSPYQADVAEAQVRDQLSQGGNRRFIKPDEVGKKTWQDALKGFEMRAIVEITNEASDQQAVLTTLSTTLQTIASNPAILQDPNAKMLFGKILTETGVVSPLELSTPQPTPTPTPAGPVSIPTTALPQNVLPQRAAAAPLVGG